MNPDRLLGRTYSEAKSEAGLGEPEIYLDLEDEGKGIELCARSAKGGIEVLLDESHVIHTVFLFAGSAGTLPYELSPSDGPAAARDRLGVPTRSGSEFLDEILGTQGAWDRWDLPTYSLHVQYQPGGRGISQVTVMRPDRVPK